MDLDDTGESPGTAHGSSTRASHSSYMFYNKEIAPRNKESNETVISVFYDEMLHILKEKGSKIKRKGAKMKNNIVKRLRNYSTQSPRMKAPDGKVLKKRNVLKETPSSFHIEVENTVSIDEENMLKEKLEELANVLSQHKLPPKRNWSDRQESLDLKWEDKRRHFFVSSLQAVSVPEEKKQCVRCQARHAFISCKDCFGSLLCTDCDIELHKCDPLHDREHWIFGHMQPLASDQTVIEKDDVLAIALKEITLFSQLEYHCPLCEEICMVQPGNRQLILVNEKGRHDLNQPELTCICGYKSLFTPEQYIQHGYWPGNPTKVTYVFSSSLMFMWDRFSKHMPGTSTLAFIKSLEDISERNGRVPTINNGVFSKAYKEWSYKEFEMQKLQGHDYSKCPPCSIKQHSVHVDGNRKVYRYEKVPRGSRESYYKDVIFEKKDDVDRHTSIVYCEKKNPNKHESVCGNSHFKAAKEQSTSMKTLDETGVMIAGCRHAFAQRCLNMFRGEQFAYPHYLHCNFAAKNEVAFLWYDVVCKYWPWAERQDSKEAIQVINGGKVTELTKPALSVMHAKGHSANCQVNWGGRWQIGAAWGPGEEDEQINSYLSRTGATTKYMTAANREETITEHLLFWNEQKLRRLEIYLCQRLKKIKCLKIEKSELLQRHFDSLEFTCTMDELVALWKADVQNQVNVNSNTKIMDDGAKMYRKYQTLEEAKAIKQFLEISTSTTSKLTNNENIHKTAAKMLENIDVNTLTEEVESWENMIKTKGLHKTSVLENGKIQLSKIMATDLQIRIETLANSIDKRKSEINRIAGSSKEKNKLRVKTEKEKCQLKECIIDFNDLARQYGGDIISDNESREFPWLRHCSDSTYKEKKDFVDKAMEVERLNEEISLIKREMTSFCIYYENKISVLKKNLLLIENEKEEELNMGKYASSCLGSISGKKALLHKGIYYAERKLKTAIQNFNRVLGYSYEEGYIFSELQPDINEEESDI